MEQQEYYIPFPKLRASYQEVKAFLEKETADTIEGLDTDIEEGLHIAGDDTYELIEKFISTYKLNAEGMNLSEYFLSEGEQFDESFAPLFILSIPVWITIYLLKLLSFGRIDYTNIKLVPEYGRKTKGMTFADLVTWHVTGNYSTRSQLRLLLKTSGNSNSA